MRIMLGALAWLACALPNGANSKKPFGAVPGFGAVPAEQRESLENRLALYVKENRARHWGQLYDLVSDTGRGGVDQKTFVSAMKAAHGKEFANAPDLLEFRPDRSKAREDDGYDVYGCGKAQREGRMYNGIAVVHAVLEHKDWFFTGWSFTEFPNKSCAHLADPVWRPYADLGWDQPMEEVRSQRRGVPFHVDKPN